MDDVATLITAIAALVTAIGGATAGVIVAWRSAGRQRVAAAEEAERLAIRSQPRHAAPDDERDQLAEQLEQILRQLKGDADGSGPDEP